MQGSQQLAGQQHNDVLTVDPVDDDARFKLLEELKRRGNAAFKVGSLRESEVLYSRGIEICKDIEVKKALLSNRSMTRSKMGDFKNAKSDADELLKLDDQSPKAHYRSAVALRGLQQFTEAILFFNKALTLDPKNKSIASEINKTQEAERKHIEDLKRKEKEEKEFAPPKQAPVIRKATAKSSSGEKAKSTSKSSGEEDLSMRGYRKTKDGRVTTFFNVERSEEDLKLLGENKPQKLSENGNSSTATPNVKEGASAWNQGGTFEEKDFTEWGKEKLKSLLLSATAEETKVVGIDDILNVSFSVVNLKELEGSASKTFTRGQMRRIFDFNFKAQVKIKCIRNEGKPNEITLDLFFPDFNGDVMVNNEEIECEIHWDNRAKAQEFQPIIKKHVSDNKAGIRGELITQLQNWYKEFNQL